METVILVEQSGKRNIRLFGRDKNRKRIVKEVKFEPYFYIQDEFGEHRGLYGEKLKKVFISTPGDVPKERKKYKKTWEADIHYPTRYMIDKVEKIEPCDLRICYFDIETNNSLDVQNAPEPITCISCYDNFMKKMITFVWHKDLKEDARRTSETSVYSFRNEKDMIWKFIQFIKATDPDLVCGWNSDGYDFPYLWNRCRILEMDLREMSLMGRVSYDERYKKMTIKGRVCFDLLKAYKKLTFSEKSSYSLDFTAQQELGDKKIDINLTDVWNKDIEKLIEYNQHDVMLLVRLDKKKNLINFFNSMRMVVMCNFDDLFSMSRKIDVMVLRECKGKYVLPTKEKVKREKYEGAKVFDVIPGLHKNVVDLDLKSLYPNIILSYNMSPETLSKWGEIRVGNGVCFKKEPEGIFPKIVRKLFVLRNKYSKEKQKYKYGSTEYKYYNDQEYAVKDITRALYGVFGFSGFRLFKLEIASSITYIGRKILAWTRKIVSEEGFEVVAGDTDSCLIKVTGEDVIKESYKLRDKLNRSYDDFAKEHNISEHKFQIELDKFFSKIFFIGVKKRYAGTVTYANEKETNYLLVMGFEYVRSDTSPISKKVQKRVFEMVLGGKSKDEILNFINQTKEDLMGGKYSLEQIAIPKGLTKWFSDYKVKSAYIKGAEYSNKYLNTQFVRGSKVKFLYVSHVPNLPQTDGLCFEKEEQVPEGTKINWDKMFPRLIDNSMQRIFDVLNWEYTVRDMNVRSLMEFV